MRKEGIEGGREGRSAGHKQDPDRFQLSFIRSLLTIPKQSMAGQ